MDTSDLADELVACTLDINNPDNAGLFKVEIIIGSNNWTINE